MTNTPQQDAQQAAADYNHAEQLALAHKRAAELDAQLRQVDQDFIDLQLDFKHLKAQVEAVTRQRDVALDLLQKVNDTLTRLLQKLEGSP